MLTGNRALPELEIGSMPRLNCQAVFGPDLIEVAHLLSDPVLEDLHRIINPDVDPAQRLVVRRHMDGFAAEWIAPDIERCLRLA